MAVAQPQQQQSNKEEERSVLPHPAEEKEQMKSASPPSRSPASVTPAARADNAAFDCDGVQLLMRRYKLQAES